MNVRGFPGLDDSAVRAAIAASFSAWEDVSCDGEPLGFRFLPLDGATDLTVGPIDTEPNLNVISWLSQDEWQQLGFGPSEFARTKVWIDQQSGEIVGADIAFNGAISPLAVCPDQTSCAPDTVDLQNVATHEIGHFLGLAHSAVPSSTMWCAAQRGDHEKRTLDDDDVAGLCAVYEDGQGLLDRPSAPAPKSDLQPKRAASCAIGSAAAASPELGSLILFGLALSGLAERRVRRPRPTEK